jgi:NAD(P)-dependent dehydrogenase (short-subunit alcohol dehydrogenase family)
MNRLKDKRALIFGVDPISVGIAVRFAAEGADVSALDEPSALTILQAHSDVHAVELADESCEAAAASVLSVLAEGALDILVIGAGDVPDESSWKSIEDVQPRDFMQEEGGETARALAVAQAPKKRLAEKGGSIIVPVSPAGLYSEGGWGARPLVHHSTLGLARTLAAEWGAQQIRVNTLVPFAETPGLQKYRSRAPQLVDWRISKTAMRRSGDVVRDIGGAAVFLASEDTRYVTGSMIFADGGAFLTTPVIETSVPRTT